MSCYTPDLKCMEININCDLGEKSKFHSIENDPELLNIVNSANVACGYHAGDEETMELVIKISKSNGVKSIEISLEKFGIPGVPKSPSP